MKGFPGVLACCGAVFLLGTLPLQGRTWTSVEGRTIEAEAIGLEGGKVSLRLPDGRTVSIPVEKLSESDRTYLRSWIPPRPIFVPEGAVYHEGSWYGVVLGEFTRGKAAQKAEAMRGKLAIVGDAATNAIVVRLAKGLRLWIDGSDEEVDGLWKWSDGRKFSYTNWAAGEPNGNKRESYIRLGKQGNWCDVPEGGGRFGAVGFVIQWD